MPDQTIRARRSLLYMPGARLEIYPKALGSGADLVCVDLEDAVAADAKDAVRGAVLALFAEPGNGTVERLIRVNGPDTDAGKADLEALAKAPAVPDGVVIAKCRSPEHVRAVAAARPDTLVHPLVESARGLEAAFDIASASERVGFLMLGSQDMATDLRCDHAWEPLLYARSRLVAAAAAAGVEVLDAPYFDLGDAQGLAAEAAAVRALGFTGKSAIHPKQIAAVNAAFSPSAEEAERARELIRKFEAQDKAAVMIDGVFMEPPIVARLKRLLAAAEKAGS